MPSPGVPVELSVLNLPQAMPASRTMPVFRALQQAVSKAHEDLASACDSNLYTLRYLCAASKPAQQATQKQLETAS
ncbi:probable periodic tryptophan protein 2 [Coccomyxa sp. Obi]|nr:probable periodic tryptophan protein 2 [Coccomyxa sp. Obi]